MAASKEKVEAIRIKPIEYLRVTVSVIGDTLMVQHRIGETAIDKLEENTREKKLKVKRAPRIIEKEYNEATYFMPDGKALACPSMWFKASMINACSFIEGISKTLARAAFFIEGDFVPVIGARKMRMDVVHIGGFGGKGTSQTRYRPEIFPWAVVLPIKYRPDLIDVSDLCNLLNHAGFSVGVGEDRPQKRGGQWGLFHVASEIEKKAILKKAA